MTFNSYIFILLFLPLVLAGYYYCFFLNKRLVNIFLLIASAIFYAFAGWKTGILLLMSIVLNYGLYRLLTIFNVEPAHTKRKCILFLGVAANLTVLVYFKYYNFFIDNLNMLFDTGLVIKKIFLPLGISFITFQEILCFFSPHVSSGPIILHEDFFPLLRAKREMRTSLRQVFFCLLWD